MTSLNTRIAQANVEFDAVLDAIVASVATIKMKVAKERENGAYVALAPHLAALKSIAENGYLAAVSADRGIQIVAEMLDATKG